MAAARPTIDLDESIAALAARAHVSAPNKKLLQQKLLQQGVGNVAELLTAIQGGTSATALGFSPAALALCERVLPDETLRSAEAAAAALAAAFAALSVAGPPGPAAGAQAGGAAAAGGRGLGATRGGEAYTSDEEEAAAAAASLSEEQFGPRLPTASADTSAAVVDGEEGRRLAAEAAAATAPCARSAAPAVAQAAEAGLTSWSDPMEEEVLPGGAAPAEGEEGGRSRSPNGPGRAPYWGPAGITPPETPVSDAAGAPHPFILLDEATGSKAGEAAAEALAEAAVDAVYGALVAATLEEWAGARTDNPVSAEDARGPGLECQDCGKWYATVGSKCGLYQHLVKCDPKYRGETGDQRWQGGREGFMRHLQQQAE
ncbi:hypothetical protein EMIHUDRAFT_123292, partial [Emiliania huxleyi CCMP1516]|uniref:SAP domain-containing protein n=2 Tax=Emiliania huxleyi TaxID=2903 RepID=A0A0D3JZ07_EMIH1